MQQVALPPPEPVWIKIAVGVAVTVIGGIMLWLTKKLMAGGKD